MKKFLLTGAVSHPRFYAGVRAQKIMYTEKDRQGSGPLVKVKKTQHGSSEHRRQFI